MGREAIPAFDTKTDTSRRLIHAACEVFAREGIGSATTRQIASVAGVNEVTLFRKFQTKQGLLEATMREVFERADASCPALPGLEQGASLREVVAEFARIEMERKMQHISFQRTLLGEIHRLGPQTKQVLREIFQPWEDRLANQLRLGQQQGVVRQEIDPEIVVDQLVSMIFIGAVRFELADGNLPYEAEAYLESCVEMVIRMVSVGREEDRG